MIPKAVIERAIAGGWRPNPERTVPVSITETGHWFGHSQNLTLGYAQMVLDPEFWSALGKEMGWKTIAEKERGQHIHPDTLPSWILIAHRFYDLILSKASQEEIDNFWEGITK